MKMNMVKRRRSGNKIEKKEEERTGKTRKEQRDQGGKKKTDTKREARER